MSKNSLQSRVQQAFDSAPNIHTLVKDMGVSANIIIKIKNDGYIPKQHRVIEAIEKYLKKHNIQEVDHD